MNENRFFFEFNNVVFDVETLFMLNMIIMWITSIHYFVFNMCITFISSFDCSHVSIEFQCIHTYMSLYCVLVWRTQVVFFF